MPHEIELKLAVDLRDVPLLRKSPTLNRAGRGKVTRKRIVTTYYDTPSLSLLHHAVALRVRKVGRDHVQSIKIDKANGSYPAKRAEFESLVPRSRPDLKRIEDRAVRRLVKGLRRGKRLRPVFSTDVVREVRLLESAGNEIECAIDRGVVASRGKKQPICELELELKSGNPSSLLQLARRLNANIPLRIEPASKGARGYALVTRARPAAPKAKLIKLDATMSAWDCLKTAVNSCTTHVVAAADYAFKSDDPEGIHQMRVAIRRMRAAFSIIQRHVADDLNFRITNDLRSLQQKLGGAREWDVLVKETLEHAPRRLFKKPLFAELGQIVGVERSEGHVQARDALHARDCTDLLLRLAYWIDVESGLSDGERPPEARLSSDALADSAIAFAAGVIRDYHRKSRKLGRRIRDLDPTQLHRLRIRIKKLRYAIEFFGSLWPPGRTKKYLSALKDLQEGLGTYHDTTVATGLLANLGASGGSDIKSALDDLGAWLTREQKRKREEVIALWSLFAKRRPFWKK